MRGQRTRKDERAWHTPNMTREQAKEWELRKAFIVRFFADGGFRVEGPFAPAQVQRLLDAGQCHTWVREWALFAIWGKDPVADVGELFAIWPEINEIALRLAHKGYQPLKANHYRARHTRHWQEET